MTRDVTEILHGKPDDLVNNIDRLSTTELGAERIRKNLELAVGDVVSWCVQIIENADSIIRKGKNWYVQAGDAIITINAHSYTIITAHKTKGKRIWRQI